MKRMQFLRWIKRKVFKIEPNIIPPWYIKWIYYILFPFNGLYQNQSGIRYDFESDKYFIEGMEFYGQELRHYYERSRLAMKKALEDGFQAGQTLRKKFNQL